LALHVRVCVVVCGWVCGVDSALAARNQKWSAVPREEASRRGPTQPAAAATAAPAPPQRLQLGRISRRMAWIKAGNAGRPIGSWKLEVRKDKYRKSRRRHARRRPPGPRFCLLFRVQIGTTLSCARVWPVSQPQWRSDWRQGVRVLGATSSHTSFELPFAMARGGLRP
jgi:hypothetical protein